jgi:hypothetical protein
MAGLRVGLRFFFFARAVTSSKEDLEIAVLEKELRHQRRIFPDSMKS